MSLLTGLSTFTCKESEEVYSISTVSLTDGLEDRIYFAVGTVFIKPDEVEPSKGRVMLFDVVPSNCNGAQDRSSAGGGHRSRGTGSRGSWLLASDDVEGCVYSISSTEGYLVIAVNSAVRHIALCF